MIYVGVFYIQPVVGLGISEPSPGGAQVLEIGLVPLPKVGWVDWLRLKTRWNSLKSCMICMKLSEITMETYKIQEWE